MAYLSDTYKIQFYLCYFLFCFRKQIVAIISLKRHAYRLSKYQF